MGGRVDAPAPIRSGLEPAGNLIFRWDPSSRNQFFIDHQPGSAQDRILHDFGVIGHFHNVCLDAQVSDDFSGNRFEPLAVGTARAKYFDRQHDNLHNINIQSSAYD